MTDGFDAACERQSCVQARIPEVVANTQAVAAEPLAWIKPAPPPWPGRWTKLSRVKGDRWMRREARSRRVRGNWRLDPETELWLKRELEAEEAIFIDPAVARWRLARSRVPRRSHAGGRERRPARRSCRRSTSASRGDPDPGEGEPAGPLGLAGDTTTARTRNGNGGRP
jgi:hypothetical protein